MDRAKFKVEIPTARYFKELISCEARCPVHTQAGRYIQAIAEGKYEEAYLYARKQNPFVYSCARICAHPCEDACRRGRIDEPLAICALKRTATDRHNIGAALPNYKPLQKNSKRVAIIGAGPCGLTCAHDLALLGYEVTVFEAQSQPGGMLYLGVPVYRLPRDIIRLDIEGILGLGVKLKTNTSLGEDFSIEDLRSEGYDAIFIATGASRSRELQLEGVELDGVLKGIDFLLNVNLGYKVDIGRKVLIIGGGNVAVDVARTAARQNKPREREDGFIVALDVSRTALRRGAREVHIICLESKEEMPAYKWEIEEAESEGIVIHPSIGPKRILGEKGYVRGVEVIKVKSVFDADGRFNPKFYEGTEYMIEADTVILTIGQTADLSFIKPNDGIEISKRGTIVVDDETLSTAAPGIFAGGDVASGPRLLIDVIADGRKAAIAIHRYISGRDARTRQSILAEPIPSFKNKDKYDRIPRQKMPTIPMERRIGIAEVELGFSDAAASQEANRCLRCQIETIFDNERCILCGGCVDICPYYCLRLARLDEVEPDEDLEGLLNAMCGISFKDLKERPSLLREWTIMMKDEERCIRCGLCAKRCPTGAITMEDISVLEEVIDE